MMNRCKIWMLIFGLLTVQAVQAQDDFIQRADKLYKNQIYDRAADMYLTYLHLFRNYHLLYHSHFMTICSNYYNFD